jgi:hypothetical protein
MASLPPGGVLERRVCINPLGISAMRMALIWLVLMYVLVSDCI